MARRLRVAPGGFVYHVVNRAAGRHILFETSADYAAFERLLSQAQNRIGMRILAYCLMRNHWHLLPWPADDGSLSTFMQWLTGTHARRWAVAHDAAGRGAVYQRRFKSMPVQSDHHLLTVWRYVERNPLRANLVNSAQDWHWSSLSPTRHGRKTPELTPPPIDLPPNWTDLVNTPHTAGEVESIRASIDSRAPFGDSQWSSAASEAIVWRPHGRPKRGRTPFSMGMT
jgi:putative transposase